jgi:plasmid stabilization system protein ParE
MARAFWTEESLRYISDIYRYIADDSPQNAENFLNNLMDSVETQLLLSADIGRITPEFQDINKREIIYKNYRVLYNVSDDGETAYITQVQHGAKPL